MRAFGQASVSFMPDQAKIDFAVVTQAATAHEAASTNADQSGNLMTQLRSLLGAQADIKTVNYSLTPIYSNPRDGSNPALTGYTAMNTIEVTTTQLPAVGRVIDTAIAAGANRVQGLRFGLRDEEPARGQALRAAALQAKAHADAMAAGLGLKTGAVHSIEEGAAVRVIPFIQAQGAVAGASTPVEPGLVQVQANVTLDVDLNQ